MRNRNAALILVTFFLALTLASCQRSASQAPAGVGKPTGSGLDFVVGTQSSQALAEALKATENAVAKAAIDAQAAQASAEEQDDAPIPTPEVIRPAKYTLQPGEWPICIARRYDLDVATLLAINGLDLSSKPGSGVTLNIPASGNWSKNYGIRSLRAHPVDYTVQSGDTLYTIACRFGDVTPEAIIAVNSLSDTALSAGQILHIP